jgi:glycerol-3-phosphate dehydrogenase (NAD(P)+)
VHLARVGHDARLWGRDAGLIADMRARQVNTVYLPDIRFPESLRLTADMSEALDDVDIVVIATP